MYPLVVDTKFKTTNTNITVNTVDDGIFSLLPESWKVEWTVGGKDGNGFTDLEAARKTASLFKDPIARVGTGAAQNSGINEPNGRVITLNLGALQVENEGSANFNLKYVPFSLNSADKWAGFTALNKKEGVPVWIIRNGINDQAQNSNTDFSSPGTDWAGTKNGNGAVAFKVFAPVTGITDVPKTTAVGTLTLSGTVVPSNAINKTITWSIKDAGTTGATINGNVLTTTTLGTVTVRATIANGTTIGAAYTQDFDIDVIVPVTGISFNNTEYVVYTGKTITVPPIITPATATNQVVSWTSSPSNTATVDSSSGLVTGIKVGTAYITAKSADGPTGSYKVTVKQYVPVTGISLSTDTFLLEKGASSKNLSNFITATVTPTDASPLYSGVTWSISPESIATLSGTPPWIKPQGVGTATLTATNTDSGVTATCTVEVVSGRFVVISSTGGVSWSVDGIKWNKVTAQLDNAYRWSAAVYDGTKFVTVGWEFASARKNKIAYSTDGGESWMEKPIDPPPNGSFWWKLAYGGGKFVMVPDSYKTSPYIAYSTNGTTWTQHSTAGVMGEGLAGGAYIYYAKDKFIVLPDGVNNTNGAYSTNGTTWTLMTMPAPPNNLQWGDLAYGKGKFVVVPGVEHYSTVETKSILISDNGTSWTQMNALPNRTWVSVIFGGDKFVAFPYSNGTDKGAYSTDGQSWSVANIPALAGTHSGTASYGNGRFVAIHANNAVWSKDGITWTQTQNSVFSTGYESGTITYGAKN
jgi:uncharacterized protein YjdB